MKKIVFFDIDGTLLDHDKKLPDSAKESLEQLKKNGVFVAIATGRAPFMFESLREELDIDSFVSFNGQYVVFENEVIYRNPMKTTEIEKISNQAKEYNHPLIFMNEKTMKATVKHHELIESGLGSLKFPHPDKDIHFYKDREIYQSLIFCEEKEEKIYHGEYPDFRFIRWHPFSSDILPAGGSKAEGIKKMIDRLGFDLEDVYAFGDGLNDIEMLETVGNGVAMGNAKEELKKVADYTTTDVDQDGIWNGLKALKLI
ncbi:Cof-type HAD-IIB family hydrolase [Bacillus sp. FJAT-29790]|uniref:Cof-type HAD-IIB family hydrolase n=1 Tax=Bacillus sp. FJAT-29790 TaxID=1895002 RepID=UPI001C22B0C6|nr:Cof-type HAD-IIB family hydrolase [Bacillus sp. FJAT-29790]MBU8877648.1 Cof-type HAD-IIB family hydrolase [Bacillus sp. FJAT-29790]